MLKKKIPYVDFDGNQRNEDFYFSMSEAELFEMELIQEGGMEQLLQKIIDTQDRKQMIEIFKGFILKSYGEKSLDGKRFIKNQELTDAFTQTNAYSNLFMELTTNHEAAAAFINGIMPQDLAAKAAEISRQKGVAAVT